MYPMLCYLQACNGLLAMYNFSYCQDKISLHIGILILGEHKWVIIKIPPKKSAELIDWCDSI